MNKGGRRTLVVTADDFGLSEGVNRGILEAFHHGLVRNTTVIVNYPDAQASIKELKSVGGLDVGIHLNLTAGPPVSNQKEIPSLVNGKGEFPGLQGFMSRALGGWINWKEAAKEFRAQMERAIGLGCRLTSITSHQHIHMLPPLLRISAELAKDFGVRFVRKSRFINSQTFWPPRGKALALYPFSWNVDGKLGRLGLLHNDVIFELPPPPIETAIGETKLLLETLPVGISELVCHPGYSDHVLSERDGYTDQRLHEMKTLVSDHLKHLVFQQDLNICTFRSLSDDLGRKG